MEKIEGGGSKNKKKAYKCFFIEKIFSLGMPVHRSGRMEEVELAKWGSVRATDGDIGLTTIRVRMKLY